MSSQPDPSLQMKYWEKKGEYMKKLGVPPLQN
jgi:hypothetical protein